MNKQAENRDHCENQQFGDLIAITRDIHQLDLILQRIEQFILLFGRRPRVLISHTDRHTPKHTINRISAILAQWGFDVDIGPMQKTPDQIALMAQENDVHMIILLCLQELLHQETKVIKRVLRNIGAGDILVTVFGQITDNAMKNVYRVDTNTSSELKVFNPKSAKDVIAILDTL
jgi:methylmalonyl-CoA mutase cobalamin-binding domain/chain